MQQDRRKAASPSEEAPKVERRGIGDIRVDWDVLDPEEFKKELEEADFDVFYSPSSEPLEGLADIKEVDEAGPNMEEEDNVMDEEVSDVPDVS